MTRPVNNELDLAALCSDPQILLNRPQIDFDHRQLSSAIDGKSILITGAGGSIGVALVQCLKNFSPGRLVMCELSERALYDLQQLLALSHSTSDQEFVFCLGNITDRILIRRLLTAHAVDVVFHAAAFKHVPILEENPSAAIINNTQGTLVVAEESLTAGVQSFVLVSTDKAVQPVNVLGKSKQLAERITTTLGKAAQHTEFSTVRFGNVLGSSGSVLSLFVEQINAGRALTVTHPEARRYFLTSEEAACLILLGSAVGQRGEILIPDAGEPIRILDMACRLRDMARSSVQIDFVGLRPGDKLSEQLHSAEVKRDPVLPMWREAGQPFSAEQMVRLRNSLDEVGRGGPGWALKLLEQFVENERPQRSFAVVQ